MKKSAVGQMTRQKDIVDACERHSDDVVERITRKDLRLIPTLVRIYWRSNLAMEEITELISNPSLKDEKVLRTVAQDVVSGKSEQLEEHLFKLGHRIAQSKRPSGFSESAVPCAITFSCEAILARAISPVSDDLRKVDGFPNMIVAGRTSNGKKEYSLLPIAFRKNGALAFGIPFSNEVEEKVKEVLSLPQADFCAPFFAGFRSGQNNPT